MRRINTRKISQKEEIMEIKRGEIVLADLNPSRGSEQGGIRPVLIIQNNEGNDNSPTTIVAPITSKKLTKEFATNVFISKEDSKLNNDSTILLNQIKTIDKRRIVNKLYPLNHFIMKKVDMAIKISLDLE
jgi:mRNA interferase MazF